MKPMRKLVIAFLVVAAAGCDATRRDFHYCDNTHGCKWGYSCDLEQGVCLPGDAAVKPTVVDATPVSDVVDVRGADVADLALEAPADSGGEVAKDVPIVDAAAMDQSLVDAPPPVDASQPIEVAQPDTRIPDAIGSCSVDNDCVGVSGGPFCVKARCVACKTSTNCNNTAGLPFCSAQNTCVSCAGFVPADGGVGCSGTAPVCDSTSGSCVECTQPNDCKTAGKGFCVQNQCRGCDYPGATAGAAGGGADGGVSKDGGAAPVGACPGAKPVCVPSSNTSTLAGQCVGCLDNNNCSGTTPICSTSNVCVPCTADSQCTTGPGICLFHDPYNGRCATDAETIYVQKTSNCIDSGTSTSVKPFCQPQAGVNAVAASSGKRVILMQGTLGTWTADFGASSTLVSVIGQNSPIVSVGAADTGIHIRSGKVYIRGLRVQGVGDALPAPTGPGIEVDSGVSIGLDRCYVTGTAGGLLVHNGAGYDVENSMFVANQAGVGDFGAFGGVTLGSTGTGLKARFWFNTIADNAAQGAVCTTKGQLLTASIFWQDVSGELVNCGIDTTSQSQNMGSGVAIGGATSSTSDPGFSTDKPYHLTANSPCHLKGPDPITVSHPSDDIDGEARPNGLKLDCGADQYWP
jgi:hypothetical protein